MLEYVAIAFRKSPPERNDEKPLSPLWDAKVGQMQQFCLALFTCTVDASHGCILKTAREA
jgi:hypothetical protein